MTTTMKRIVMGVVGAGLLLAGLTVGVIFGGSFQAFAAGNNLVGATTQPTTSQGQYCALYEQTLAKDLGVSQSKLQSANQSALQTVLDQMQKDGKITAAQKAKLEARLAKSGSNPCAALAAARGHHGRPNGPAQQALMNAHTAVESAVASKLGISTTTLESDLASGQTIAQIAQSKGVALSDVNTVYENAVQAQLKQAVSNGTITQAQSNMLYTRIQSAVNAGHYPLLGHGHPAGPAGAAPAAGAAQ